VSLVIDPAQVPPGSPVAVTADAGLRLKFWEDAVPSPTEAAGRASPARCAHGYRSIRARA
jgi:hypothetical protein